MKYTTQTKSAIVTDILERIARGDEGISAEVSADFDISPNTVHTYMRELIEGNVIRKLKRARNPSLGTAINIGTDRMLTSRFITEPPIL